MKDRPSKKTESDKKIYQQKAEILDKQIDALIYELYGLSEGEIFVVEGGRLKYEKSTFYENRKQQKNIPAESGDFE
jgi:hypothetical protein